MAERLFYEFRAPKFVDFTPMKIPDTSAYFDIFNGAGNMDIDISLPLFSETGRPTRMSSTPNKRDSCTQTPSENAQEEEGVLSDALDNMLRLEHPNNRRSVRFSDAVHVCPSPQSSKSTNEGRSSGGLEGRNSRFESKCQSSDKDSKKRQTTPIIGQTWHQALKYRSVEQHVSTPKPKKEGRSSLLAEPILRSGGVPTRVPVPAPRAEGASKTPSSIPRPVQVKVRVDPKPVLTVKPFQLTTYKPRQSPLEDPVKFFQRSKDTPVRHTQAKPAVRRLPTTDKETDISTPVPFRARPPLSLHQKPFSPRHVERPPIKTQPFRLHTEERAKKREEFENKIQEHLLQLEVQRQQIAAEKERQEALERKEMRRVKIHARPVPSFVYSPVSVSPKTLSNNQRAKGTTPTIE